MDLWHIYRFSLLLIYLWNLNIHNFPDRLSNTCYFPSLDIFYSRVGSCDVDQTHHKHVVKDVRRQFLTRNPFLDGESRGWLYSLMYFSESGAARNFLNLPNKYILFCILNSEDLFKSLLQDSPFYFFFVPSFFVSRVCDSNYIHKRGSLVVSKFGLWVEFRWFSKFLLGSRNVSLQLFHSPWPAAGQWHLRHANPIHHCQ